MPSNEPDMHFKMTGEQFFKIEAPSNDMEIDAEMNRIMQEQQNE